MYRLFVGAGLGLAPQEWAGDLGRAVADPAAVIVAGSGAGESGAAESVVATGLLEYPEDNFAYVSHVEQARSGAWASANPFTLEEQEGVYFNPLFLGLGWVARWTGAEPTGVMVLAGLLAAFATVLLVYRIALRVCPGPGREQSAAVAAVLVAFGSGLSAVTGAVAPRGSAGWVGVDRTHQDTLGFSTFAVYPFQAVTLAVLAGAMLCLLRVLDAADARVRRRRLVGLGGMVLLSALLRPYECVMFLASYGAWTLVTRDDAGFRRRVTPALVAGGAAAVGLGYAVWMTWQPAWKEYAEITVSMLDVGRMAWVIGFGMFLPFALLGAIAREPAVSVGASVDRRRWFAIWVAALLVALIVVRIDQVKLASGMQLPLAILAGHGVRCAWARTQRHRAKRIALCAALLGFFPTTAHLLLNVYRPHVAPTDLFAAISALPTDRPTRVLCDTATGRLLPAFAPTRVHAGHWSMTPNRADHTRSLVAAGIQPDPRGVHAPTKPSRAELEALLATLNADFILLRKGAPALSWLDDWTPIHSSTWTLLRPK